MTLVHHAPTGKKAAVPALALLLTLAAALPLGAASTPVSAKDSSGRAVSLAAPAARIISLSPAATETLFAIGAGPRVVADTTYCNYPPEALALPKIGGFMGSTISVETIVSLKPDLVISGGAIHREVETALARLGIPYFVYDPQDFAGIARDMRALGALAGTQAAADKAASEMLASIEAIRAKLSTLSAAERPTVFWEIYDEPLMTCGAATFQHAIVEAAGGRDIFSDLPGAWPVVSSEQVIARAPAFIVGSDDHVESLSPAAIAKRPGWAAIPAVKNGRIVFVSGDLVSRPSPRIALGIKAVAQALHPDLFP